MKESLLADCCSDAHFGLRFRFAPWASVANAYSRRIVPVPGLAAPARTAFSILSKRSPFRNPERLCLGMAWPKCSGWNEVGFGIARCLHGRFIVVASCTSLCCFWPSNYEKKNEKWLAKQLTKQLTRATISIVSGLLLLEGCKLYLQEGV